MITTGFLCTFMCIFTVVLVFVIGVLYREIRVLKQSSRYCERQLERDEGEFRKHKRALETYLDIDLKRTPISEVYYESNK